MHASIRFIYLKECKNENERSVCLYVIKNEICNIFTRIHHAYCLLLSFCYSAAKLAKLIVPRISNVEFIITEVQ